MKPRIAFPVLLLVLVSAGAQDRNEPSEWFTVISDIQYCTGGGKALLMDVFIPHKRLHQPTPAVLWLHGGGWERGDKNGSSGAQFLASAGFVTASIYYRLSGEAKFPADIEDCKCAIRYLRANASRYGIDANRIGIAGASSGGHLALLAATADDSAGLEGTGGWSGVSSRVKAASSYYGPTDFRTMPADFGGRAQAAINKLLGVKWEDDRRAFARASPITYVSRDDPPILVVHGNSDTLVPFDQSQRMLEAYHRMGLRATLVKVRNANHDFEPSDPSKPLSVSVDRIHRLTIEFFKKEL